MNTPRWPLAAALSTIFLAFTLWVIAREGFGGLIVAHEANTWASQVFIDLVIAASVGLVLIAPRARAVGIRLVPWVALTFLTGSIGLLALLARLWYLEGQDKQSHSAVAHA